MLQIQSFLLIKFKHRNGPEWARIRTILQQALSKPQSVRNYISSSDDILKEFLLLIKRTASEAPAKDFLSEISRVSLECKIF